MSTALETVLSPTELATFLNEMRAGLEKDSHVVKVFSASAGVVVVGLSARGNTAWFMAPADDHEAAEFACATIVAGANYMAQLPALRQAQAAGIAGDAIKKAMNSD